MIAAGISHIGENRLQEALPKREPLADLQLTWHFIGHLQGNKARSVVGRFATIQSVDSLHLATEIDRRASPGGIRQPVLIEVKLDPAQTKQGVESGQALELASEIGSLQSIDLQGFMGMPPSSDEPEQARPYFRQLRALFDSFWSDELDRLVADATQPQKETPP